jgi:hypothetical protein
MDSSLATLKQIETELQKRLELPYHWGRIQNNVDDAHTSFVYEILYFEDVLTEIARRLLKHKETDGLFQYALNRWYNYWSAQAIEKIFASFAEVRPHQNPTHRTVDFMLNGLPFDHKSAVFPKKYPHDFSYAQQNPIHMVQWLYKNQSQENRKHNLNRLFLVFYDQSGAHWKLKADISRIQQLIQTYIADFEFMNLLRLELADGLFTLSDVIWVTKEV